MYIVSIGGNIGCGKTTIVEKLQDMSPKTVFPEPIDKWGQWLQRFYKDPSKYAFPFQMKVLMDFLYFDKSHNHQVVVTERSPLDSLFVFSKTLLENGSLTEMEYTLLKEYVDKIGWVPHNYIYLRADSRVCVERIKNRSRECEDKIDPSYIQKIHEAYEDMDLSVYGTKVHVVDANRDPESVFSDVLEILQTECNFPFYAEKSFV